MNVSMCVDLYLAYKNPFYPGDRRMKFYLMATAITVLTVGLLERSWLQLPPDQFETELMKYYLDDTIKELKDRIRILQQRRQLEAN
jgi:hypothetical protein